MSAVKACQATRGYRACCYRDGHDMPHRFSGLAAYAQLRRFATRYRVSFDIVALPETVTTR
jgi:hypothetical protein